MSPSSNNAYLDLPEFRNIASAPGQTSEMNFFVEGVKCGRCVQKIESLKNKFDGINVMRFNMGTRELRVEIDHRKLSFSLVADEIEKLGFGLKLIDAKNDLSQLIKLDDRKDFRRLAIAAVCAGNIMMFSFAIYFGADSYLADLFKWLSFLLYLPIVAYVSLPFYRGFLRAIKDKVLSVDGPVAIASVAGFIFSSFNLIRGEGSIYFDSISGFLFLILMSRFLQKRMQRNFLSFQNSIPVDFMGRARFVDQSAEGFSWKVADRLNLGDFILIKGLEIIPVDGIVQSQLIRIDSSFLTGESHSVVKTKGMTIQAGTRLLSETALISVTKTNDQTEFGQLLKQIQEQSVQKVKLQSVSDHWSQVLLYTVFSAAFISVLVNWRTSPTMALERALALIILACPCAMAIGTPLALSFSVRKAFRKGFLIKSADVFERLVEAKHLFFDKTGTLTGRKIKVTGTLPEVIPEQKLALVLSLETISEHPIAEALRQYILPFNINEILKFEDYNEIPGVGVEGTFQQTKYSIRASEKEIDGKSVSLFENGISVAKFFLEDPVINSSKKLLANLKTQNYDITILSGDSKDAVRRAAKVLQIDDNKSFYSMSAREKASHVQAVDHAVMIGDGVNDALAFKEASVGIAVRGSIAVALKSADVYLLSDDLNKIDELFKIAKRAIYLVQQNLIISLIYNLVGGTAALMGFVNPFVAAILMPISSGFILFSTWIMSRR